MNFAWYDILGAVGVAVIMLACALSQIERLRSDEFSVFGANAVGRR